MFFDCILHRHQVVAYRWCRYVLIDAFDLPVSPPSINVYRACRYAHIEVVDTATPGIDIKKLDFSPIPS